MINRHAEGLLIDFLRIPFAHRGYEYMLILITMHVLLPELQEVFQFYFLTRALKRVFCDFRFPRYV